MGIGGSVCDERECGRGGDYDMKLPPMEKRTIHHTVSSYKLLED